MESLFQSNPIIDRLPAKLKQYIKAQNYDQYSAIDHSVWRYVMRKNVEHLKKVAHESYLDGLKKTGISIDQIPSMYGMNRILQDIGWAAVAVDGLIPSDAFMEFQAYNVLVIASDIRQLDHIEYTPTPDIIHESAGHAPILANEEYAEYLRRFGQIGSKAISSSIDNEIYEAVRELSILKENPESTKVLIEAAEKRVNELQGQISHLSEMTQIRNLHWWTVEYGLIGTVDNFKQYGAGLLSSIGESKSCMSSDVKKLPYSVIAAQQNFDVTKPQPQLFVTPDFAHLSLVLEEFAEGLSLRTGGKKGLKKLIESKNLGTIELSTGLQVSGVFTRIIEDEYSKNGIAYFQTTGETVLCNRNRQLTGHGRLDHRNGIGCPMGYLKVYNLAIEDMSPRDLMVYDIHEGNRVRLEFMSGVVVEGKVITGSRNVFGKIQVIYFKDCLVSYLNEEFFNPKMGIYCMPVGKEILSAYAGPADYDSFDLINHKVSDDIILGQDKTELESLFEKVIELRKSKTMSIKGTQDLFSGALEHEPSNWLLILDIYELSIRHGLTNERYIIRKHLDQLSEENEQFKTLISDGIELIENDNN